MARFRIFRWFASLLLEHWGTKTTAVVLASVLFIVMRDDVTREFTVPLDPKEDPERDLKWPLPKSVTIEVHGPWTRINRLSATDFGPIPLDLTTVKEGRLEIDESQVVMPPGVLLRGMIYEKVDVRFDDFVVREFPVVSRVYVEPDPDYEVVSTVTNPDRVRVRGPESVLQEVSSLETVTKTRTGVAKNEVVEVGVLLPRPREKIKFVDMGDARPTVSISITVRPKSGERKLDVDIERVPEISSAQIPPTLPVTVRGPLPALRRLDGLKAPVNTEIEVVPPKAPGSVTSLTVKFVVTDKIPEEVRASLVLDPPSKRFELTPPPIPQ